MKSHRTQLEISSENFISQPQKRLKLSSEKVIIEKLQQSEIPQDQTKNATMQLCLALEKVDQTSSGEIKSELVAKINRTTDRCVLPINKVQLSKIIRYCGGGRWRPLHVTHP